MEGRALFNHHHNVTKILSNSSLEAFKALMCKQEPTKAMWAITLPSNHSHFDLFLHIPRSKQTIVVCNTRHRHWTTSKLSRSPKSMRSQPSRPRTHLIISNRQWSKSSTKP